MTLNRQVGQSPIYTRPRLPTQASCAVPESYARLVCNGFAQLGISYSSFYLYYLFLAPLTQVLVAFLCSSLLVTTGLVTANLTPKHKAANQTMPETKLNFSRFSQRLAPTSPLLELLRVFLRLLPTSPVAVSVIS